ncbi:MAG: nucleotide sugar dehydrogenase [Actinobacteria bacterium]|nr:MAG: nucleotide sugar dehydrogenase [Actinomycetota bacterium]
MEINLGTEERVLEETEMSLEDRIANKTARMGVIGMGYVGLPLAVEMAGAGFRVTGIDVLDSVVEKLSAGESHIPDVPSERVAGYIEQGLLEFTTDPGVMGDLDVLSICVPTPLNEMKGPDLVYVREATSEVAEHLRPGQLVVLESTTYPGTTEEVLLPILSETGLAVGEDFYLAFSPERVDPGNKEWQTKNTPKVVGGVTQTCTEHAKAVYEAFIDTVVTVSSPRVAEMTKLLENIFRGVNIALVNELLLLCDRMKIDIWEVVDAAKTKPFGFMPFYPGPGLGGHCIPIDPFYLSWKARQYDFHTEFIELSGKINEHMPYHVCEKVAEALNLHKKAINGSRVMVLGAAYKKDIDDKRESPAIRVMELLLDKGAKLSYHDPYVARVHANHDTLTSVPLWESLDETDCVVVVTAHSNVDYAMLAEKAKLVVDCRNAVPKRENVVKI